MKVEGFGPKPTDLMCVSEAPGFDEETSGFPFYDYDFYRQHADRYVVHIRNGGKSGREYTRYLVRSAKVPREQVYTTNLVKYRPDTRKPGKGNSPPTAADIKRDEPELVQELIDVQPKIVCAIGRFAIRWFLGKVTVEDTHGLCFPFFMCQKCGGRYAFTGRTVIVKNCSCHGKLLDVDWDGARWIWRVCGKQEPISVRSSDSVRDLDREDSSQREQGASNRPPMPGKAVRKSTTSGGSDRTGKHTTQSQSSGDSSQANSLQERSLTGWRQSLLSRGPAIKNLQNVPQSNWQEVRPEKTIQALVVCLTHPAAGLHATDSQPQINLDFQLLGAYLRGEISTDPPVNRYPDPDYYEQRTSIATLSPRDVAVDTESRLDGTNIWGASYTFNAGSGAVIRASSRHLLPSFRRMLATHRVACHNLPHDARVICKLLGMSIYEFFSTVDAHCTMQMAFIHRLLPRGLKPLAKRFENMPMRPYSAVVGPADQQIAEQYLLRVLNHRCPTCEGACLVLDESRVGKTGKPLQAKPVTCPTCNGDGTAWEQPEETAEWDHEKQQVRLSRGWGMGRRVRRALEPATRTVDDDDVNDGDDDSPDDLQGVAEGDDKTVQGLRRWWNSLDYTFRVQVEDALGPMPEATLDDIPKQEAIDYAGQDADALIRVWPRIEQMVRAEGLWSVYEQDLAAMPMFCQMMEVGWKVDVPYLHELSNTLSAQMDVLVYRLEQLAGHYVNPNSTKQVGALLFDELGQAPIKFGDGGLELTNNKILRDIQIQASTTMEHDERAKKVFDATGLILNVRELSKLRSTYALALPRQVDERSRVHTEIKQAVVESRRPASRNPNLANIPARSDNGKLVRHAFTCEPGNVLVEIDYDQIEFRILAHESGEESLIDAICKGLDPHALTTEKIFGIPIAKVTKKMWQRRASKTFGFLILYGGSPSALKTQLKLQAGVDVPIEQCQAWIEEYTQTQFPAIGEYIQDSIASARRYGYAADGWGHRRYLPGLHSPLGHVRAESERVAVNHRIQGFASGVIKTAMDVIWRKVLPKYRKRGYCEPLMQVYDSLVHEVKRENAEDFMRDTVRVMNSVVNLRVPITAEGAIAERWDGMKD